MVNIIRKDYSTFFNIPSEYFIVYDVKGIKGAVQIRKANIDARCNYMVIQSDGTIIETATLRQFYNIKGQIAFSEADFVNDLFDR